MASNDNQTGKPVKNFKTRLGEHCSGAYTQLALKATSAWLMVTGIKELAGMNVDARSALFDLAGIVLVIGAMRWHQTRGKAG